MTLPASIRQTLLLTLIASCGSLATHAQGHTLKALFLGNSFTGTNDLPLTTATVAQSMGDTLRYDSVTPGGNTLQQHASNPTSLGKIAAGDWHYVILQEQSQRPAFPDAQVATEVFPYARQLDSTIHAQNNCASTIFYMTWGYPDGDAGNCPTFPPICTYQGMDSMLHLRYMQMADSNHALISPVGQVFHNLIKTAPGINLFLSDRMHPSVAGTYVAALTFYTIMFRRDPLLIPYNGPLSAADAATVKHAVHDAVFASFATWHVGDYDPKAAFTTSVSGNKATFNSSASANLVHYTWDFGDGAHDNTPNPVHTYTTPGTYHVRLIGDDCKSSDTLTKDIIISGTAIPGLTQNTDWKLFPNPAHNTLYLETNNNLSQTFTLTIYNTIGQAITNAAYETSKPIDISQLSKGLYFLELRTATGENRVLKFTKD